MIRFSLLFLIFISLFMACTLSKEERAEYLPNATGKSGDMIIIMDSLQWRNELGQALQNVFTEEVEGLPRPEKTFNVKWIHPNKKIKLLTQVRNLVYVFTLDEDTPGSRQIREGFTQETLDRIQLDTSFYLVSTQDEFSKGQEVMYLFSDTKETLIKHLERDGEKIQDFFNKVEKKRTLAGIYRTKSTTGITSFLKKEYGFEMRFPVGFQVADQQTDFVWIRLMQAEVDNNVFVSWKPYESEYQLLPDSLVAWRDQIAERYLFEDPDNPYSYVVTETTIPFIPVKARQITLNDQFVMQLKGLWKTNNKTMGGPFVSNTLVDAEKGRLYYIEGFTFSPSKPQREIMRELETILETFKPVPVSKP